MSDDTLETRFYVERIAEHEAWQRRSQARIRELEAALESVRDKHADAVDALIKAESERDESVKLLRQYRRAEACDLDCDEFLARVGRSAE